MVLLTYCAASKCGMICPLQFCLLPSTWWTGNHNLAIFYSSCTISNLVLVFRFMSRMKARPKHLSCIAISSFHLAASQWVERLKSNNNEASPNNFQVMVYTFVLLFCFERMILTFVSISNTQVPEPQDLVLISQCKCTAGDIMRMEKIVEAKLACLPQEEPVTTLTFLSLYHNLLKTTLPPSLQPDLLILSCKLETIFCDSNYAAFPSSLLALALLFTEVKSILNSEHQHLVHSILAEIKHLIQVIYETLQMTKISVCL